MNLMGKLAAKTLFNLILADRLPHICKSMVLNSWVLGLLLIGNLIQNQAMAQQSLDDNTWFSQSSLTIKQLERNLASSKHKPTKAKSLTESLSKITAIKKQAQDCITREESQLSKTIEDLQLLGEAGDKAPAEVIKKRLSLSQQQKKLDKQLASCRLLLLQSQDLIQLINERQQNILAKQLSAQTPHIIDVLQHFMQQPVQQTRQSIEHTLQQLTLQSLSTLQVFFLIILVTASLIAGAYIARRLRSGKLTLPANSDSVAAFILASKTSLTRHLALLLSAIVASGFLSLSLPVSPLPLATKLSYLLVTYFSLIILINTLLSPVAPAEVYLTHPAALSRRLARHLKILTLLSVIGAFMFSSQIKLGLGEPTYYLGRSLFGVVLIINLISTLWLVRLFSWAMLPRGLRIALTLIMIASLITELMGYRNLSTFVLGGLLATSLTLGLTLLLFHLLKDLCDGLDEGRLDWEATVRERAGISTGSPVPGLAWIRMTLYSVLWGGFAISVFYIWKLDDPWLGMISDYLTDGFTIGSLRVSPTLLIGGILAFVLILNLTQYIKKHFLPRALKYTNLDMGAREAISSLLGYTGVAIAILLGLSISGVQMQNIAIIAGALSVGIGFGLQNIVNNFISGLILLFERPIRRGDWIETGNTEGYVKAINIRSTQIQTFDRAEVIVPNSELITAKVTNWMLRDSYGRIAVKVGVSYDADVDKVHKVLLHIAEQHPMVIQHHASLHSPRVLFRQFADSALEFELRCFIHDIDQRVYVVSELNFAILKAFRKEGIEIPFPQRVVHLNTAEKTESTT